MKKTPYLLALLFPLFAWGETVDGINYALDHPKGEATIIRLENKVKYAGDIVVPPTVNVQGKTYQVTKMADVVFYQSPQLTSVVLPEGIKTIPVGAFAECPKLHRIVLPPYLATIEAEAFMSCTALGELILPPSVSRIEYGAFKECKALKHVALPEGVKSAEENLFWDCSKLQTIHLPASLREIQVFAFLGCNELRNIVVGASTPPETWENDAFEDIYDKATVWIPQGSLAAYQRAQGWKLFKHFREGKPTGICTSSLSSSRPTTYDLYGRAQQVQEHPLLHLPKGVYIVNGTKQLIP